MKIPKVRWGKDQYNNPNGKIDLCNLGLSENIHLYWEDKVLYVGDYEKEFSCFLAAKLGSLNCIKEALKIMVRKELEKKEHHAKKAALLASLVENK